MYLASTIAFVFYQDSVRGLSDSKLYALCGIFNSFIMLACEIVGLIGLHLGVLALLVSKVVAYFVTIILIIIKKKDIRLSIKDKFDRSVFRELKAYSAPLVPNAICWWIVNSSDRYIIRFFLGTSFNGIYAMSNKFPTVLTTITSIFYLAWQESAIKEYDSPNRDDFFSTIFRKYYVLLFTLTLCAIPATKLVIELFVSSTYKDAWMYTGFLFLGAAFSALCSFLGLGYQISKETSRSLATTIFAAGLNIAVNTALVNYIGLHAASISTFAAYLFLFIIRIQHTKRYYTLNVDWCLFIVLCSACLASIGVIFVWKGIMISVLSMSIGIIVLIVMNKELIGSIMEKVIQKIK